MEVAVFHREACFHGGEDFAGRYKVDAHTFLFHNLVNALEATSLTCKKRLTSLTEKLIHSLKVGAAILSYSVFVHKVKGCAVLLCKLGYIKICKVKVISLYADIFTNHNFILSLNQIIIRAYEL